jgi:hypothetical protein
MPSNKRNVKKITKEDAKEQVKKDWNGDSNSKRKNRKQRRSDNKSPRGDQIKIPSTMDDQGRKGQPSWYFKDATQAELLSRIQMNGFGAINGVCDGQINPTIMGFYLNPCPGVTPIRNGQTGYESAIKGINRAAQKLWYILTAKSGRAAGYSKADVALLLLAIGAMIETYEFIRRIFGLSYIYNQRNRAVPTLLWQAMGVKYNDYRRNAAVYLKRMNSLMAVMNQLPIPGNIAWFAKCQYIYQNIFTDYNSEMAQLYVMAPSTTWVIEEDDAFIAGSYLRTVDMCLPHSSRQDYVGYTSGKQVVQGKINTNTGSIASKTLGSYIDVFEEQVNALLFSTTFSQIYADILRAFDNGTLARWSFDYIDEMYKTPFMNSDPEFLDQVHNATMLDTWCTIDHDDFKSNFDPENDYADNFKYGTPRNDVYQWALTDTLVYNPPVKCMPGTTVDTDHINTILDFVTDNPSVQDRIEATRFCVSTSYLGFEHPDLYDVTTVTYNCSAFNLELPDHWIEKAFIFRGEYDGTSQLVDGAFRRYAATYPTDCQPTYNATYLTKFHHAPILNGYTRNNLNQVIRNACIGDLTAWTLVESDWFAGINEMIYVDLFDIR